MMFFLYTIPTYAHTLVMEGMIVKFLENIINMKVNGITANELIKYGKQFDIHITKKQAEAISSFVRGKNFDIFNNRDRARIIKEIALVAGADTAKKVNQLFLKLTK